MGTRGGLRWHLVNGAMELSWFLGWAMFCSLATLGRPFPFCESIAVFALAAAITHWTAGRGWLIAAVLGLELFGLTGGALLLIHGIYCDSRALLDGAWLTAFLEGPQTVSEGFILLMHLLLILLLWALGATLARRPGGYHSVCNRFDLGLAAFFALFLVKLVALTKGEALAADSLSLLFVFPFFFFGLLAVATAHPQSASIKAFLPGYGGLGVVASFAAAVLLGTGGLLLFLLPGLTAAAQMGYWTLAAVGKPLVPVLVVLLRFLFGPRGPHAAAPAPKASLPAAWESIPPQPRSWWMELLETILNWGLWGLILIMMLFAAAIALYYGLKWLFSRTERIDRGKGKGSASWFARLRAFLPLAWRKIAHGIKGYPRAVELYGALIGWACRGGLPHRRGDTPREFGARLIARFPELQSQIGQIIGAYHQEVYGEAVLESARVAEMNRAWRSLRSPSLWPARLKGWFSPGV